MYVHVYVLEFYRPVFEKKKEEKTIAYHMH